MDIQDIASKAVEFSIETYESVVDFAVWGARRIQTVVGPVADKIRDLGIAALKMFESLLRSGPTGIFAISGALFVLGMAAFKMADRKAYEEEVVVKSLWKAAGVAAFVGATFFVGLGMASALTA